MAGDIYKWDTTFANNGTADGDVPWPEGMARRQVNNSARGIMGRVAEYVGDIGGALAAGGTANDITVTANSSFTAYADGMIVAFKAASDNTGATTLNVNAIGTKAIRIVGASGDAALSGSEIQEDGIFVVHYNSSLNSAAGGWQLLNPAVIADGQLPTSQAGKTFTSSLTYNGAGQNVMLIQRDSGNNIFTFEDTSGDDKAIVGWLDTEYEINVNASAGGATAAKFEVKATGQTVLQGTQVVGSGAHHLIETTSSSGDSDADVLRVQAGRGDNAEYDIFTVRNSAGEKFAIDGAGAAQFASSVTASSFSGDGSSLTSVDAATLDGNAASFFRNAGNLNAGTLPDGRFPATLPAASGVNLTSLNASNLGSGTVASARVSGSYTGITGTGALDAGSITSGFGNIDIGSSTFDTTGAVATGALTVSGALTVGGDQIVDSNGNTVACAAGIFAHLSGGTMNLRPNGAGSSTNQTTIDNSDGSMVVSGDVTANSDRRLKKNIRPIEGALEKIRRVDGVRFERRKTGKKGIGFVAQDMEAVFPELVHTGEDGFKSVAYGNAVAVLWQAVKELEAR